MALWQTWSHWKFSPTPRTQFHHPDFQLLFISLTYLDAWSHSRLYPPRFEAQKHHVKRDYGPHTRVNLANHLQNPSKAFHYPRKLYGDTTDDASNNHTMGWALETLIPHSSTTKNLVSCMSHMNKLSCQSLNWNFWNQERVLQVLVLASTLPWADGWTPTTWIPQLDPELGLWVWGEGQQVELAHLLLVSDEWWPSHHQVQGWFDTRGVNSQNPSKIHWVEESCELPNRVWTLGLPSPSSLRWRVRSFLSNVWW